MAIRHILVFILLILGKFSPSAQMVVGEDTLVGNEWIRYGQEYFKFTIDADGIYRIPFAVLEANGLAGTPGSEFRLYSMGKQVPLYVSTPGIIGSDDFIEL